MGNRKIEYVFGPDRPRTGHTLGVTALAVSHDVVLKQNSYGTLISGGRGGRINAWALGPQATHAARVNDAHADWITAVLVNNSQSVLSASADTTVKLWNLEDDAITTIGHHTDYAQCLARVSDTVCASGGLDHRILGWDLTMAKQSFEIPTDSSVYSLATVGNLIVSGCFNGCVCVWDQRQPKHPAVSYRSHTDNVRCLYSVDGDRVVSGSSDGTVKVWSLRNHRLLNVFTEIQSSVWSMHPSRDNAGVWVGDRDGSIYFTPELDKAPQVVTKNALKSGIVGLCPDYASGNVWACTPFCPDLVCLNALQDRKEPVEILKGHSGLKKHRLLNDKRHVLVLDTKGDVAMVDLVSAKPVADFKRHIDVTPVDGANGTPMLDVDEALDKLLEEVNTMDVLDNWCQVQVKTGEISVILDQRSIDNAEVYLDELQQHVTRIKQSAASSASPTPEQSPFTTPLHTPLQTPVQTPGHSPTVTPSSSGFFRGSRVSLLPSSSGVFRSGRSPRISPAVSRVTSSQSLLSFEQQQQQQQPYPVRQLGTGKGHAKFYDPDEEPASPEPSQDAPRETPKAVNIPKSTVSSKVQAAPRTPVSPKLAPLAKPIAAQTNPKVKLNDDETEEPADTHTFDDEIRIDLGNFVLENLFRGLTDRLVNEYESMPEPPQKKIAEPAAREDMQTTTRAAPRPEQRERKRTRLLNKIFGKKKEEEEQSAPHAQSPQQRTQRAPQTAQQPSQSEPNPQLVKQKHQQEQQAIPDSQTFLEAWSRAVANRSLESADPEGPPHDVLSRRARVIISEIAPGAGAATEVFSTTVGRLIYNKEEADRIAALLPGWVGDALLLGKLNLRPPVKIGFAVQPQDPNLPNLTPEATRLMAVSMLRVRKIMIYTIGQLEAQGILTKEASSHPPEDIVQLSCHGVELSPVFTLATVRTRIWRQSGDVGIEYALKLKV